MTTDIDTDTESAAETQYLDAIIARVAIAPWARALACLRGGSADGVAAARSALRTLLLLAYRRRLG